MLLWLAATAALADPPDATVRLWQVGDGEGGAIERMDISLDGDVVAGRSRNDLQGWVLDIERWVLVTYADCDVTGVAIVDLETEGDDRAYELWASCGDGRLIGKTWDGYTLGDVLDGDGVPLEFSVDETLSGVWWHPESAALYAVSVAGDLPVAHVVDPFASLIDEQIFSSYPTSLVWPDFNEGLINDGSLIVSHGGRNMSSLLLGSDGATAVTNTFVSVFDCDDMALNPFGGVYCVDGVGQVASYQPITNLFSILPLGELSGPQAVCASPDPTNDGWIAVTGEQVKVWEMDGNGTIDPTPYFEGPPDADNPIQDMVTRDGYLFGGGEAGNLHVVTARPWMYPANASVTPTEATDGDTVSVTFLADEAVDWEIRLNGDRTGTGTVLRSGSSGEDEEVTEELEVDLQWVEGDNDLYIMGISPLTGLSGHAVVTVDVDNPPRPPALTDQNLAFADQALVLEFDGIPDEDLAEYEVYVTTTPWDGADYETSGPEYDGTTDFKNPLVVPAVGGAAVSIRIEPLENYVTHYVGVRAIDAGGLVGAMSTVISGTPEPSFTAGELAGETGGNPCDEGCSTGGQGAVGWLAVALGAVAVRRRRGLAALAAVGLLGLATPQAAHAQDDDPWWKQDFTPSRGDFEIRYGVIELDDEDINSVYGGKPANLLQMEVGPQFWRIVEIDVGFGFFQELANTVSASGAPSGDRTMLTWWPLVLDGTLRLHVLDEQPVVPFVRYGWDYVIFSELSDDGSGGKTALRGAKTGNHTSLGANLLLDIFQPERASFLEAQTGINDTWLTFEWRQQRIDDRARPWSAPRAGGFDFSGDAFLLGLKLDY